MTSILSLLALVLSFNYASAFIEGLYCGKENCYDVLEVNRDSTKEEISRRYRLLARKWHPDLHKTEEAKQTATERFRQIANAYEVLKDEESRKDYDYMLDNPDEMYAHYYRYYRRMYAPKVDVRIVIVVTITVISVIQYWAGHSKYKEAIDYFLTVPKYRLQAQEIAKDEGLLCNNSQANKKKNKYKTKEQIKEEEESILRKIIEDKMDIRGAYSKPSYRDLLWVQLVFLPYYIGCYLFWHVRWIWKFNIKQQPYQDEEKLYLIRKYLKMSQLQFDGVSEDEKQEYLDKQLWVKDNFTKWKQRKDDEVKAQLAESSSYKRYRRYLRKGGPGQITFLDD